METTSNQATIYTAGMKLRSKTSGSTYIVEEVKQVTQLTLKGSLGSFRATDLETYEPVHLTEEEAWVEVAFKIAAETGSYGLPLLTSEATAVRRESYRILYSNGIQITNEVKERVRGMMRRYEQVRQES